VRNALSFILFVFFVVAVCGSVFAGIDTRVGDINEPVVSAFSIEYDIENLIFARGSLSGTVYPYLPGLKPSGKSGAPMLPMETHKIVLHGKWNIAGVGVRNIHRETIPGSYDIVPNAKPLPLRRYPVHVDGDCVPDPAIYDKDDYFPGGWLGYISGYDGENTLIFIRIYPIQYNPVSGSLEFLVSGDIEIYGSRIETGIRERLTVTDAANIIITTGEFESVAEYLRDAHELWGTSTAIVYSDSIRSAYSPAPGPVEFIGYAHDTLRPGFLSTYDYDLALRIIAFLRDESAHPELQSVTILGDASDIPPSYYAAFGYAGFEEWGKYIPTDAFYASPDYDFIPNYAVGRLAVGDATDAARAVQKIIDTEIDATSAWFENAYFTGGSPWAGTYYESEIYITSIHNAGFCDALNSVRSYCSEGGFTYSDWTSAWWSGSYGIFWILAHGSGYIFAFDDWSEPDFGVTEFTTGSMMSPYPILFGGNCSNGIYDEDIISDIGSDPTFAEAFIRGTGGGSMLIASSRVAYGYTGYPIVGYETDINQQRYLPEFGYRMMEAIAESPSDCGELFKKTTTYFVEHGEMLEDTTTLLTYFEMIMHGDPVMPLPEIDTHPVHNPCPSFEFDTHLDGVTSEGAPVFHIDSGFVRICVDSGLAPIYAKALRASAESPIYLTETITGDEYDFPVPEGPQYTSLRIESSDGKARWLYFLTSDAELVPDGKVTDWEDADIAPGATDPDDFAENYLELTDLYGYIDGEYLFIGFPFFETGDTINRGYTICIDSRTGGSAYNADYGDAAWTFVNFPARAPDYEIVVNIYYNSYRGYPYASVHFYEYSDLDEWWMWRSVARLNSCATVNTDSGFVEVSLDLDSIGFDDEVAVLVYSFPIKSGSWEDYPSQDATPFNSGSHNSVIFTSTPNVLTEWLVLRDENIEESGTAKPKALSLSVFPNPFNENVAIFVNIPKSGDLKLEVFDISGKLVWSKSSKYSSGTTRIIWDGRTATGDELPSGTYLTRATLAKKTTIGKVTLIK